MVSHPSLRLLIITACCILLCCCIIDLYCKAAAQSADFSISFDTLSNGTTTLVLEEYGRMEAYVAYTGEGASWLVFIPAARPTKGTRSYILSILVFSSQPPKGAIVWMANRNNPVSGNFSLSLDQPSGNLLLHDGNGSLAWSSKYTTTAPGGPPRPVSMHLLTNPNFNQPIGTLLLSDANNITLWKSSNSPASLSSLMAFGDLFTAQRLVSWASPEDPSEGLYSLVMEVGGLVLYYNAFPSSQPYWIWSYYNVRNDTFNVAHTCRNLTIASILPEGAIKLSQGSVGASPDSTWPALCSAQSFTEPSDDRMEFDDYGVEGTGELTFLQLEYDGNLKAYTVGLSRRQRFDLFDGNNCLLPNHCGPYGVCTAPNSNCACPSNLDGSFPQAFPSNPSEGCPPTRTLTCHNGIDSQSQPDFLALEGVDYFSNRYTTPLNFSTKDNCTAACTENCSCLAAFWHVHSNSCFHAEYLGSLQGSLNASYLAFLKVEHIPQSGSSSTRPRLIIIGVASGVVILSLLAAFIYRRNIRRAALTADEEDPFWTSTPGLPTRYSYKDLHSITNGFSEQMGKGGFGFVYAGTLLDGTKVAVKRLESLRQGKKEFRAEVVILGGIHHYNLVDLIGFCAEGSHRLLVYEFLAKRSLDQWLFKPATPLPWKNRYNIAVGAARGLAYLHGGCKETIIHLDIKPENILLDEDFVAKVSDFGLSTLMARNETHVVTTMRGTPGYLAPEWISEGCTISEKCDVFSFGKLLMEILGARRNLDPSLVDADKVYFPSWLYHQVAAEGEGQAAERLAQIAMVETTEELRQARLMMNTAFLCILESPDMRPSMEKVVQMLQGQAPDVEHLQASALFQGLHFSLRTPSPEMAQARMEEALASLYSFKPGTSHVSFSDVHVSAR